MNENTYGVPYLPESQTELDGQLLRIDNRATYKNKQLAKLLSDDLVRSYLDEYKIKALYHLAASYEALCDANQGKYEGVFDNACEAVLTDINFIVNIARSNKGVNVLTVKGRAPLEQFKEKDKFMDRFKPVPQDPKQQNQGFQPNYAPDYSNYQR